MLEKRCKDAENALVTIIPLVSIAIIKCNYPSKERENHSVIIPGINTGFNEIVR